MLIPLAHACPPGTYPVAGQGWSYCAAVPGTPTEQSAPDINSWDHWQATAIDTATAALGTAVDKRTAIDAERDAVINCERKGGRDCKVQISYVNGCVAMAVGDKVLNTNGAPTREDAIKKAMRACSSEDNSCKLYYSSCSIASPES